LGTRHTRFWFALSLAGFLALPAATFSAVSAAHRARAVATFERANRLRTTLRSQPENRRTKKDYEKVIQTYLEVYRLNPAYSKTPVSLLAVAELYEEMGRVFSNDRYYLEAVKEYGFLSAQYPKHHLSRDALFTVGEIYRSDLENPEEARKAFQEFLRKYPKSSKAAEAQEKLKQIEQLLAEPAAGRSLPPRAPHQEGRAGGPPEVTDIRRWVGPSYSRIVIGVEGDVKFDSSRLANPDRIVLDLENSRLSPALVGKTFPVEDGYLRQIRVAQYKPNVTRIVLDVQKIEDYSVFTLPNPFRLVIDVHGATAPAVAKAAAPPAKEKEPREAPPSGGERGEKQEEARAASTPPAPGTSPASAAPAQRTEKENKPEVAETRTKTPSPSKTETANPPAAAETREAATLKPPLPPPAKEPVTTTAPGPEAVTPAKPEASAGPGSRTLTRALGLKVGRIVIDPGHGGHDTGTIGPTGLMEKDVVLDVALRLKKLLERNTGCEVIMTRSDDTFIPLEERTAIANSKAADLFISIHANASRDRSARGIETYYLNFATNPDALEVAARENSTSQESVHQLQDLIKKIAMTEKIEESQQFARLVQHEVHLRLAKSGGEQRDRGIKKAPFVVLIGANMPSVLAEISFLTNPRDERWLKRPEYRQRIADALYKGVGAYMSNLGIVKVAQQTAAQGSSAAPQPNF